MIVVPSKKALVIPPADLDRVRQVIPTTIPVNYKGKVLGVVPHRLDEVRVLNNIGIAVPNPIRYYYNWPGRFVPFAHQIVTSDFLTMNARAFCLNDMGTGKTLSALWAFDYLRSIGAAHKMLIFSPLSTLERVWGDEIFLNFPGMQYAIVHGYSRARRVKLLEQDADVYIVNHDGVKVLADELAARTDIDVVLIDESPAYRNHKTDRWKAMKRVLTGRKYIWLATGSPIPNAPTDAWAQCKLVVPENVPQYFTKFRDQTMRQVGPFRWIQREEALEVVRDAMQPSVRFKRDDCIDLPPITTSTRHVDLSPEQHKMYKEMATKMRTEYKEGTVFAVNDAVKAMKLVQIACIAHNTPVLTHRGWVPIQGVLQSDRVWDGLDWVPHSGLLYRGRKPVVSCFGVRMTEDHEVMTTKGWRTAKEIRNADAGYGYKREEVRAPDGAATGWLYENGEVKAGVMALSMRLWKPRSTHRRQFAQEQPPKRQALRMSVGEVECYARDVPYAAFSHLVADATALLQAKLQRLGALWSAWGYGVRAVAQVVREFLGGYGRHVHYQVDVGADRQQRPLLTGKLQVGDSAPTRQQQTEYCVPAGRSKESPVGRGSEKPRAQSRYCTSQAGSWLEHDEGIADTYDIAHCGPRNRFVVRGIDGQPLIVHNCGVAYAVDGEHIVIPAAARIEVIREIIEEAEGKVIVFVPLTGGLQRIAEELRKSFTVEIVHGETPIHERDDTFGRFQRTADPQVIVAHPKCMAHGLNLNAANTVVWYIPTWDNEVYEQACARIPRPGQKLHMHIVHIEGTEVERRMYKRLAHKGAQQETLLDMLEAV